MAINKQKKNVRQRGTKTHGYGSMKKHRGAGHRGGRGNAGSGKRGDKKRTYKMQTGIVEDHKLRGTGYSLQVSCKELQDSLKLKHLIFRQK